MTQPNEYSLSRRNFLKLSGATVAGAIGGSGFLTPALGEADSESNPVYESKYGVCDMCFNKCSLIARVRNGIVEKLGPQPQIPKVAGYALRQGECRSETTI